MRCTKQRCHALLTILATILHRAWHSWLNPKSDHAFARMVCKRCRRRRRIGERLHALLVVLQDHRIAQAEAVLVLDGLPDEEVAGREEVLTRSDRAEIHAHAVLLRLLDALSSHIAEIDARLNADDPALAHVLLQLVQGDHRYFPGARQAQAPAPKRATLHRAVG